MVPGLLGFTFLSSFFKSPSTPTQLIQPSFKVQITLINQILKKQANKYTQKQTVILCSLCFCIAKAYANERGLMQNDHKQKTVRKLWFALFKVTGILNESLVHSTPSELPVGAFRCQTWCAGLSTLVEVP